MFGFLQLLVVEFKIPQQKVGDNQIISQDKQIGKIFNKYFKSIPILNMPTNQKYEYSDSPEEDLILRIKKLSKPSQY